MQQDHPPVEPRVAVGALVFKDNAVLLVQRDKPPAQGKWAIPGGKVKPGESLQLAAEREILEETGVRIHAREPIHTFELINRDDSNNTLLWHYVIIDLLADYVSGEPKGASDARAARWVTAGELGQIEVDDNTLALLTNRFGFGQ